MLALDELRKVVITRIVSINVPRLKIIVVN